MRADIEKLLKAHGVVLDEEKMESLVGEIEAVAEAKADYLISNTLEDPLALEELDDLERDLLVEVLEGGAASMRDSGRLGDAMVLRWVERMLFT